MILANEPNIREVIALSEKPGSPRCNGRRADRR